MFVTPDILVKIKYLNRVENTDFSLDCSLRCVMGRVNADCDACMCEEHILLGSVRSAGGLIATGAAILRANKLLTLTDHNGHFRIPGICPDGNTTLTVNVKGHASLNAVVPSSTERTSVLTIQLKRAGRLLMNLAKIMLKLTVI